MSFSIWPLKDNVYILSLLNFFLGVVAMICIARSLGTVAANDTYAIVQTALMVASTWIAPFIDVNTHVLRKRGVSVKKIIPPVFPVFAIGACVIATYTLKLNSVETFIVCAYLFSMPIINYRIEIETVITLQRNLVKKCYQYKAIRYFPAIAISFLSDSLLPILFALVCGGLFTLYALNSLNKKYKEAGKVVEKVLRSQPSITHHAMALLVSITLSSLWYFDRFTLSQIGPGLSSISYQSMTIVMAIATILSGTYSAIQFGDSHNQLYRLIRHPRKILCSYIVLSIFTFAITIYLISNLSKFNDNEILYLFYKNRYLAAIYITSAVPISIALFLTRMLVAEGKITLFNWTYASSLILSYIVVSLGYYLQNPLIVSAHFFIANSALIVLIISILLLSEKSKLSEQYTKTLNK